MNAKSALMRKNPKKRIEKIVKITSMIENRNFFGENSFSPGIFEYYLKKFAIKIRIP